MRGEEKWEDEKRAEQEGGGDGEEKRVGRDGAVWARRDKSWWKRVEEIMMDREISNK